MNSITSPAAQIILSVIPIVGIVIGGTIVLLAVLWHHTEVKMKIKTGTYQKQQFDLKTYSLLIGLLLTAIGGALTLFFVFIGGISQAILGGLIPLTIGISLLFFYKLNDWKN